MRTMARFTLPRDVYHGKGCLEELKNLKGKKAIRVVGGGSMKRQGFLDKAVGYLKEAGMEVQLFEGVEPDPSVETVMKGAKAMQEFEPDWIVAMGGGSPIDAAKAMWAFYEYPDITFEDLITPFSFPELRQKAKVAAIPSTSGTATEVTAFSVITDYAKGIKYPLADFNITPDIAFVDSDLVQGTSGSTWDTSSDRKETASSASIPPARERPSSKASPDVYKRQTGFVLSMASSLPSARPHRQPWRLSSFLPKERAKVSATLPVSYTHLSLVAGTVLKSIISIALCMSVPKEVPVKPGFPPERKEGGSA